MDMDLVRPQMDPWGLSPSLRPWEAWAVLTDLCGCSGPVGPPGLLRDAYIGCVCHCHCAGHCCSRYLVRLVWIHGSAGCRTIVARTPGLILQTLPAVTFIYRSYLFHFEECHQCLGNYCHLCGILESCGDPNQSAGLRRESAPRSSCAGYPPPCLGVIEPPHGLF